MTRAREQKCRRTRSAAPARVPRQGFFSRRTRKRQGTPQAPDLSKGSHIASFTPRNTEKAMIQDGWWTASGNAPEGPVSSRRGRRPENASEGSVSLPEYASSVKDDRSGWKGEPLLKKGKMSSAASPFFSWSPSGGGEAAQGGRSRSLKRIEAFRAVRAEEGNIFLPICCQRSV